MVLTSNTTKDFPKTGSPYCAVVVTFRAQAAEERNIIQQVHECGFAIVVDNGSEEEFLEKIVRLNGVELVKCPGNIGLGAALNLGLRRALEHGFRWAITFDQDSRPQAGFAQALWVTRCKFPEAAVVAPRISEPSIGVSNYRWLKRNERFPLFFERVRCGAFDLPDITISITSGSLTDLSLWEELKGFREEFFIDYIDVEYCLRVRRSGRTVAISAAAVLDHELGARQARVLAGRDFRPTFHAAFRHYYIARNRVPVWRDYALREPHWAIFDFCYTFYNMLRVFLFEDAKLVKLKAFVLGSWDGIRGRSGPLSPHRFE